MLSICSTDQPTKTRLKWESRACWCRWWKLCLLAEPSPCCLLPIAKLLIWNLRTNMWWNPNQSCLQVGRQHYVAFGHLNVMTWNQFFVPETTLWRCCFFLFKFVDKLLLSPKQFLICKYSILLEWPFYVLKAVSSADSIGVFGVLACGSWWTVRRR